MGSSESKQPPPGGLQSRYTRARSLKRADSPDHKYPEAFDPQAVLASQHKPGGGGDGGRAERASLLIYAALRGDAGEVRRLTRATRLVHSFKGPKDINATDADGNTALMVAAREGHVTVLKALLRARASKEARNADGDTALCVALRAFALESVAVLLKEGAKVNNVVDHDGFTPLSFAARCGLANVVEMLVKAGADPAAADARGRTPISRAVQWGHTPAVRAMLARMPRGKGVDQESVVLAAARGDLELMRELLNHGANPNSKVAGGFTALGWASFRRHDDVVQVLARRGADVHARDDGGRTALVLGAMGGSRDVAEDLLTLGADPEARDSFGNTPLMWAAGCGNWGVVNVLLAKGVDLFARSADGRTAREFAWKPDIAELLLKAEEKARFEQGANGHANGNGHAAVPPASSSPPRRGVRFERQELLRLISVCQEGNILQLRRLIRGLGPSDINIRDDDGNTALIVAAQEGHAEVLECLINHGADAQARNSRGESAVFWAAYGGFKQAVEALVAHGADLQAPDSSGTTPLMAAASNGHGEVVELLLLCGADASGPTNADGQDAAALARTEEIRERILAAGAVATRSAEATS